MKRLFVASLFLFPFLIFAYQSPGKPTGYVNDFAGMFNPGIVEGLNNSLTAFKAETGSEISVVTINKLEDETIETYAEKLFQEWGIGTSAEDNGVLLLISKEDREMRIEVGYGLEPIITDIESGRIIQETLVPSFQQNDFDSGLIGAVDRLKFAIRRGEPLPVLETPQNNFPISDLFYLAAFFLMGLASVLGKSKSWWAGGFLGGIIAVVVGLIKGFMFAGLITAGILIPVGLLFDFLVSKSHAKHKSNGTTPPWLFGGGRGGGGGFGGFGGGRSGGGGASGKW